MLSTYFGDEHLGTSWLVKPGGSWTVTDPGLNIKRYASCALTHRCIDAALALRAEHAIAADTIDSVVCFCPARASEVLRYPSATDGLEARFCMPFAVASALIHGDVGPSELDGGGFATVVASGLVQRIDLRVHPDWHDGDDARPDLVEIRLCSGERLQRAVAWPKGHARNPIEWPDVVGKFRRCTIGHLRDERAEQCVTFIERLADQRSLGALAGLVA